MCAAGYGSTDGAACTICPVGSFWPGAPVDALAADAAVIAAAAAKKKATLTACLPCKDANEAGEFLTLTRGAKSEAACVCKAGYGGSLCSICPQGTWSAGGSTAPCTACGGLGTTDAEGATSVTQCGCQAGYGGSKCEVRSMRLRMSFAAAHHLFLSCNPDPPELCACSMICRVAALRCAEVPR